MLALAAAAQGAASTPLVLSEPPFRLDADEPGADLPAQSVVHDARIITDLSSPMDRVRRPPSPRRR